MRLIKKILNRTTPTHWAILLLLVFSLLKFFPFLLRGKVPLPFDLLLGGYYPWLNQKWGYAVAVPIKNPLISDVVSQLYPWLILAKKQILSGGLPLWNPTTFLGYPYFANYHSSLLYPSNLLLLLGPLAQMRTLQLLLQQFLTLLFMFLFLRSYRFSHLASLLAAAVFASGGLMTTDFEFASGSKALTWLPLCLLLIKRFQDSKKNLNLVFLSFSYAVLLLSGHFQVALYSSLIIFLYLLHYLKTKRLLALLFLLLGVFLAAPQLLPTIELLAQSVRLADPYIKQVDFGILPLKHLLTLFFAPDLFGNPTTGNYFGFWNYRESIGYLGIFSSFLILIAATQKKHHFFKDGFFLSLLFIFFRPLAQLPYLWQIPLLQTSAASRLLFPLTFFAAFLVALGFDQLRRKVTRLHLGLFLFLSALILTYYVAGYLGAAYSPVKIPESTVFLQAKTSLRNLILPSAILTTSLLSLLLYHLTRRLRWSNIFLLAILGISLLDLLRFHHKFNPFTPAEFDFPSTPAIEYLQSNNARIIQASSEVLPANTWTPYGLTSLQGYDPLFPGNIAAYFATLNEGTPILKHSDRYLTTIKSYQSPLIDVAGIRYLVALKRQKGELNPQGLPDYRIDLNKYQEVFSEGPVGIFENASPSATAFLSFNPSVSPDSTSTLTTLLKGQTILPALTTTALRQTYSSNSPSAPITTLTQKEDGTTYAQVSTTEPALFVLNIPSYTGWRAYLNGTAVPILDVNFLFMGVELPPGDHQLVFRYLPDSFVFGVAASLLTLTLLCLLLIRLLVLKRNR